MPLPMRPTPDDSHLDIHKQRIEAYVLESLDILKKYIDKKFDQLVKPMARYWLGFATSINVSAKTVTVQLDPFPVIPGVDPMFPQTVQAKWGRPSWSADQIVGQRVRVRLTMMNNTVSIDDIVNAD